MYIATFRDHYEDHEWEEEFYSLEDAFFVLAKVRDEGGDGYIHDENGEEYDY